MTTLNALKHLVEQILAHHNIWERCGNTLIQVYENRLAEGGAQFNLRYGGYQVEADIRVMEARPGYFRMAVVPCGGTSIDYTQCHTFNMTESPEALRTAFPHGRNINAIVDDLLAYNVD